MLTLFCDLDNTIVFSHRKTLNTPKRVAELLNGREQSYITEKTFRFFSSCERLSLIPVTTRTFEQYERLRGTVKQWHCSYALISNGAILIQNGVVDETWVSESKELVKSDIDEMDKAVTFLSKCTDSVLIHNDSFLAYARTSNPQSVLKIIRNAIDSSKIHVFCDNRKVYLVPTILNKGNAVRRLLSRYPSELTIAVGDNENDLSMLQTVDIPILPQKLESMINNPRKVVIPDSAILSDAACDEIEDVIEKRHRW